MSRSFRAETTLLPALPWHSTVLLYSDSLDPYPEAKPDVRVSHQLYCNNTASDFSQCLANEVERMEQKLFSNNPDTWHLECALGHTDIHGVYTVLHKSGEPFALFCSDILRYLILTIAARIKETTIGQHIQTNVLVVPRRTFPEIPLKVSHKSLPKKVVHIASFLQSYQMLRQDWPAYLSRLLKAFDKRPSYSAPIQSVGHVEANPGTSGNDDAVIFKYFASVTERMKNLTKNYVQVNFELAAIHLAIMLKVIVAYLLL